MAIEIRTRLSMADVDVDLVAWVDSSFVEIERSYFVLKAMKHLMIMRRTVMLLMKLNYLFEKMEAAVVVVAVRKEAHYC